MNCCDYDCRQGDDCPARKARAAAAEVSQPRLDIDASPDLDPYDRMTLWIAIGIACAATVAVAAGAMGYAYVKWVA